jgi:hypothetical protein
VAGGTLLLASGCDCTRGHTEVHYEAGYSKGGNYHPPRCRATWVCTSRSFEDAEPETLALVREDVSADSRCVDLGAGRGWAPRVVIQAEEP